MELNYQYINGRYEKVRHSKMQKMNEILNLKHFQEEVDRRIRKFEYVVHGSEFAPAILHRVLVYTIALFALVASILFVVSYLRVDSTTYKKVSAYNQVLESKAELGNGILTNNTISAAQDLAALTVPPQKFFDCIFFDENEKKGVKCLMQEIRIALNVSKTAEEVNTSSDLIDNNKPNENSKDSSKNKNNGPQSNLNEQDALPDDATSLTQIEKSFQLPKGRSAHHNEPNHKNDEETDRQEDDKKHKSKIEQNSTPDKTDQPSKEKEEPHDSQEDSVSKSNEQSQEQQAVLASLPSASKDQNIEFANSKEKKSGGQSSQSPLSKHKPNSNQSLSHYKNSKEHKNHKALPYSVESKRKNQGHQESATSKNHQTTHSSRDTNAKGWNQRRNLQEVFNRTASSNQTEPTQAIPARQNSSFDSFLKSPLIIDGSSYYLKKYGYLQKMTSSQIGLTIFLVINLVAIITLVIAKNLTKNETDSRLNRLIIEMMFEENSQSDSYKFYIFGSYEYIDVKVEVVSQSPCDKTNLLLTGNDQLNAGRVRPVSSATKISQYFESNGKDDSNDPEERKLIKDKGSDTQYTNYEC